MLTLSKAILAAALTLACSFSPAIHSRKEPAMKRACTINLNEGDPAKGLFVGADERSVTVEIDGRQRVIPLHDVASILFRIPHRVRMAPGDEPPAP